MERPRSNTAKWVAAGVIVCVFLVVDYVTPPFLDFNVEWLVAILLGVCIGQLNLIATWAALAPGNFVVRLPWSLVLGVFTWYAFVLGNRAMGRHRLDEAVLLGVILLGGLVVAQIPLWIARRVFRWRLVSWVGQPSRSPDSGLQFHLKHMMLGVFFVSVALAPARAVLPPGDINSFRIDDELFVLLPAVAVCNLLITIPCIWGAFLKTASVLPLTFGWLFYCAVLTAVEVCSIFAFFGQTMEGKLLLLMYLVNVSQCVTVFGTLRIFRQLGFRLLRACESPSPERQ